MEEPQVGEDSSPLVEMDIVLVEATGTGAPWRAVIDVDAEPAAGWIF